MKLQALDLRSTNISNPNNKEMFNRYLLEIGKLHPFTREEELELFKRIELNPNDKEAIDEICKHNLLFVVSVAKRYHKMVSTSTLTLEDLVGEGNLGLFVAIRKFNYHTGNKFISYAVWWIRQFIMASIQNNIKSIRIPQNVRSALSKITRKEEFLSQKLGRTPSTLEVFEAMLEDEELTSKDTTTRMEEYIKMSNFEVSLSSKMGYDSDVEISEMLKSENADPEEEMITKERYHLALNMLDTLPRQVQNYIVDFYGIGGVQPLSWKELGDKYEMNPQRIKAMIEKYLRKLKLTNHDKKDFFFPTPDYQHNKKFKKEENTIYLI